MSSPNQPDRDDEPAITREPSTDAAASNFETAGVAETAPPSGDATGATVRPPPAQRTTTHPERIGPYRILSVLGEGGMGVVYRAEQREPVRRTVALKLVKRGLDTDQVLGRFEAERQALALMDHPNVARVLDAGATDNGRPYFVMEFVAGESITTYCDRNRLPLRQRLELFAQVCDAVQHAHSKGVIHRDLKPGNVLVGMTDGKPTPKVIDFGVAKVTSMTGMSEGTLFTQLGQIIGTPEYMSPEQAESGPMGIDTRTDVYALGVMLYELLVGALPFEPRTLRKAAYDEIRRIIRDEEPPSPSARVTQMSRPGADGAAADAGNGDTAERSARVAEARQTQLAALARELRSELEWIPLMAMRKDRSRRYATVADLATDVRNYLTGRPLIAAPESRIYLVRKFTRRHRGAMATVTAVAAALVIGAIATSWQAVRASRAEDRAIVERDEANRQRTEALALASENEQVNGFLTGLLAEAAPDREQGRPVAVREVVEQAVADVGGRFADRPRVAAAVQATLAEVMLSLGRGKDAAPLAERAEQLFAAEVGPDHPATLRARYLRGRVLDENSDPASAEPLLAAALAGQTRALGADDAATLRTAFYLADVRDQLGRGDEARAAFADVLDRRTRALGAEHPDTLDSLNALAFMHFAAGEYDKAEAMFRDALARRRRAQGDGNPATIRAAGNLAVALRRGGKLPEAESLYRQAIRDAERVLGAEHFHTARLALNLALLLEESQRGPDAEPLVVGAVRSLRRTLGDASPRTADAVKGLGEYYRRLGRPADADRWSGPPATWPPLVELAAAVPQVNATTVPPAERPAGGGGQ